MVPGTVRAEEREPHMMAAVTIRQIKPGAYEDFRKAWEPDPWVPSLRNIVVLRNDADPDQVLTIGFFETDVDGIDALRDDPEVLRHEEARLKRIAPFEERVVINGIFEVADEVSRP